MPENRRSIRLRVGRNVRERRLRRGFSQERLAELAGYSTKHIGQIERGDVNVSLDHLASIAASLSADIVDLFAPAKPGAYLLDRADLQAVERALRMVLTAKRVAAGKRPE